MRSRNPETTAERGKHLLMVLFAGMIAGGFVALAERLGWLQ